MQALRWHGREDIRLDEVEQPQPTKLLDAVIEVELCGICGTDLSEYRHGPSMIRMAPHPLSGQAPPITLGHEFVGKLVEGASADKTIVPGSRVTVDACLRCGTCPSCVRGDYHRCRYGGSIGLHSDGGFARYVAVPSACLVAVPDEVTDEQAALTEPLAVGLHALERAGYRPGDVVVVLGHGPIGAGVALLARALGADPVVVELDPQRLKAAAELGFRTVESGDDLDRRVKAVVGKGGADVVVESTGAASVVPQAVACAARGGRIVLAGLPSRTSEIDARQITLYERSLIGSLGYRHDTPRVLELVRAGRLDPSLLVTDRVPLSDAVSTIKQLAASPGATIKTLVSMTP
ncbi:MAG: threonine dehydrogenase-related Zn-dependent dehydrogenase [Conexibacter sp.]|jgi:(R,R)-butanediol dehydrogenase/meso-butanediol dehydrogenase/diacetyl reductase|nr:threonine dehydrogenase-related Zn-dependent dehydrogenase [Conexibacter sp.]